VYELDYNGLRVGCIRGVFGGFLALRSHGGADPLTPAIG
jgi:hypothetical protein